MIIGVRCTNFLLLAFFVMCASSSFDDGTSSRSTSKSKEKRTGQGGSQLRVPAISDKKTGIFHSAGSQLRAQGLVLVLCLWLWCLMPHPHWLSAVRMKCAECVKQVQSQQLSAESECSSVRSWHFKKNGSVSFLWQFGFGVVFGVCLGI